MDAIAQPKIMNLLKTLSFIIQFVCAARLNNAWAWALKMTMLCCNIKELDIPVSGIRFHSWPSTQKLKIFERSEWSSEINTDVSIWGKQPGLSHRHWQQLVMSVPAHLPRGSTVLYSWLWELHGKPPSQGCDNYALCCSWLILSHTPSLFVQSNRWEPVLAGTFQHLEEIDSVGRENLKFQVRARRWSSPGL